MELTATTAHSFNSVTGTPPIAEKRSAPDQDGLFKKIVALAFICLLAGAAGAKLDSQVHPEGADLPTSQKISSIASRSLPGVQERSLSPIPSQSAPALHAYSLPINGSTLFPYFGEIQHFTLTKKDGSSLPKGLTFTPPPATLLGFTSTTSPLNSECLQRMICAFYHNFDNHQTLSYAAS